MKTTEGGITLTLKDIRKFDSVADAIIAACRESDHKWSEESVVELIAPNLSEVDDESDSVELMIGALDSKQCLEGEGDWDSIRALVEVSQQDALESIDGEIIDDYVVYFADETSRWYVHPVEDLMDLRLYMGSSDEDTRGNAYSLWCAGNPGEEYETREAAERAAKE
jgi:hypothetical protein